MNEYSFNEIKELVKTKQWEDACFMLKEEYNKNQNLSQNVYIYYGYCLRKIGEVNKSIRVLDKGVSIYNKDEKILQELIYSYQSMGKLKEALPLAKKLTEMYASSNNTFLLGGIYSSLKENEKAKVCFTKSLELRHNLKIDYLIERVGKEIIKNKKTPYQHIFDQPASYKFINGKSNYGAFIHYHGNKKYFTKISEFDRLSMREEEFYKCISKEFPILKGIVPNYLTSFKLDGILYLTIEFLESDESNHENLKNVIKTSQNLASINYKDIQDKFPNLKYSFKLKNKPNPTAIFFTKIHKQKYNEKLFEHLELLMKEHEYPNEIMDKIAELKHIILSNKLYVFINPTKHYSLIHGDFNRKNVRVDQESRKIQVIDWETYKIGLKTIDIARFVSANRISYSLIREVYLNDDELNGNLTVLEKIFFLYILVIFYILTIREYKILNYLYDFLTPILTDIENFVYTFKEESFSDLLESNIKKEKTIYSQQKEIKNLKNENTTVKKQLNQTLNSKSWKITAPLRRIMNKK